MEKVDCLIKYSITSNDPAGSAKFAWLYRCCDICSNHEILCPAVSGLLQGAIGSFGQFSIVDDFMKKYTITQFDLASLFFTEVIITFFKKK